MAGYTEVTFQYNKAAFEHAFLGNNSDIVIDKNGSVYKDYISAYTLVVDQNGGIGAAGKEIKSFINIAVNQKEVTNDTNAVVARLSDVSGKMQTIRGGTRKRLDEWSHAFLVVDNELLQLRLYVEGELVQTVSIPEKIELFTSANDVLIGRNTKFELAHYDLNGSVDDFRIYQDFLDKEEFFEKTSVEAGEDSGTIQLQASGDTTTNLLVGQYVWFPDQAIGEIWNTFPTITEINSDTTFTVSPVSLNDYTGTMRFWNNSPTLAEENAVKDVYNYGERIRHFNKKTFVSPRGENKGNVASFKVKSEFPVQIRGIAIEYNDGVIR